MCSGPHSLELWIPPGMEIPQPLGPCFNFWPLLLYYFLFFWYLIRNFLQLKLIVPHPSAALQFSVFLIHFDRELLRIDIVCWEETTWEVFSTPGHQYPVQMIRGVLKCSYRNAYCLMGRMTYYCIMTSFLCVPAKMQKEEPDTVKYRRASSEEELFRESFGRETRGDREGTSAL